MEGNLGRCETPPDLGYQIALCEWFCAVVFEKPFIVER
jgi:hypothetical protein